MKNFELTKLMYELYDREFDIDKTLEVMEALHDLRSVNQTKNRMILKHGEDSEQAKLWLERERDSYKNCELIFRRHLLDYKPYKII